MMIFFLKFIFDHLGIIIMLHLRIHPDNPQARLISQAVERLKQGDIMVYPTDTSYALGCQIGNKTAMERIAQIRGLTDKHQYSIMCANLSDIATYAQVDNTQFRLLKAHTPSAITFILPASKELPKRLMHPKRKTIGIRFPEHTICQALLEQLGEPILTTTLILPNQNESLTDPDEIAMQLNKRIDLFLDSGYGQLSTTSVVDLSDGNPNIVRYGLGDVSAFE